MRFRNKHNSSDETFWLSATDMMAGILIVVLLLLMLFLLFLNTSKDEVLTPLDATEYSHIDETHMYDYPSIYVGGSTAVRTTDHYEADHTDSRGNSGGSGDTQAPTEPPTESPKGYGDDGYERSAVFVTVVDADSGNTIKKSGIPFELYAYKNGNGGLQTLNTYYQEKTEYKVFETGQNGTFYLPEKLVKGRYSLHNLKAPEGYIAEENTEFELDRFWDWQEPYMVTVKMKPIKKTVRIMAEDAETLKGLKGVKVSVVAAEDIKTADGTVRYATGKVVDELKTDEKGLAESKVLYLGKYTVRQESVPEYYAVDRTVVAASVTQEGGTDTGLIKIDCYKTTVTVGLADERTEQPIKGAVFTMKGRKDFVTDENGQFTIDKLKKSTAYQLTLKSLPDGYIMTDQVIKFKVDADGLVDDKTSPVITSTAYTISLSVQAKDFIFGRKAKGVDLQLLDEGENVVKEWTTNDTPYIISGLSPGRYSIQRTGDTSTRMTVYVTDTSELQNADLMIWDTVDLYALLMGIGSVVAAVLVIGLLINRKKKVKRKHE